jgi:hypothetical protein
MVAASLMKKEGFHHVVNIYGGFGALQSAGAEVVVGVEIRRIGKRAPLPNNNFALNSIDIGEK